VTSEGDPKNAWISVPGAVMRGHQVASGAGTDSPYPHGSISMQLPFFKALGLELGAMHPATINVSITPLRFALLAPQYTFKAVAWTHLHPPEDFSFSACLLEHQGSQHAGWIYYPHPQTKQAHFQPASTLEILAPHISGMAYGSRVLLRLNPAEIAINPA
jgi:hypothetical protein